MKVTFERAFAGWFRTQRQELNWRGFLAAPDMFEKIFSNDESCTRK